MSITYILTQEAPKVLADDTVYLVDKKTKVTGTVGGTIHASPDKSSIFFGGQTYVKVSESVYRFSNAKKATQPIFNSVETDKVVAGNSYVLSKGKTKTLTEVEYQDAKGKTKKAFAYDTVDNGRVCLATIDGAPRQMPDLFVRTEYWDSIVIPETKVNSWSQIYDLCKRIDTSNCLLKFDLDCGTGTKPDDGKSAKTAITNALNDPIDENKWRTAAAAVSSCVNPVLTLFIPLGCIKMNLTGINELGKGQTTPLPIVYLQIRQSVCTNYLNNSRRIWVDSSKAKKRGKKPNGKKGQQAKDGPGDKKAQGAGKPSGKRANGPQTQ